MPSFLGDRLRICWDYTLDGFESSQFFFLLQCCSRLFEPFCFFRARSPRRRSSSGWRPRGRSCSRSSTKSGSHPGHRFIKLSGTLSKFFLSYPAPQRLNQLNILMVVDVPFEIHFLPKMCGTYRFLITAYTN